MNESRLKVWLMASRPKTLPAAASPVLIGSVLAYADNFFHLASALTALFSALMIQIGTNLANDYFDFKKGADSEKRLGPTRVTHAGLVKPEQMKLAIMIAFSLAFLAGCYLVFRGGWPIVIIGLASILFGILYTGGPYPLGYNGLGEIFVLIFFGPVAVAGTYYVQALDVGLPEIIIGFAPGLFSVAILTVNNLRDIDEDRLSGKRTLAARFGRGFARSEYCMSVIIASILPALYIFWHDRSIMLLLPLLTLVFTIIPIRNVMKSTDGVVLNKTLASTGQLMIIFTLLFAIGWLV